MKLLSFGREGQYCFVNSADSQSVASLDACFESSIDDKGRVDWIDIHQKVSQQEPIEIDDLVFAGVAIRKEIEKLGKSVRPNKQPYTKQQANIIKQDACFINKVRFENDYDFDWTTVSSLHNHVEEWYLNGVNAHLKSLKEE